MQFSTRRPGPKRGLTRGLIAALVAAIPTLAPAEAPKEITVAYFLEWPLPFEYEKAEGIFDKELGLKVNWRSFDTGVAMSAAIASGDVQIAISQGVAPFVTAVSAGQDLKVIDVAVGYSDNDNCVVRSDLEITKDNAKELNGTRVGVPIGTAAHYGFLKQVEHFGIDVKSLEIVDIAPPEAAAAFAQGNFDWVCGWGASLQRALEHGNVLLTGAEKEAIGIKIFDVITTSGGFAAEQPELLAHFLKIVNDSNAAYPAEAATRLPVIAKDAGLSDDQALANIKGFTLYPLADKLGPDWLSGGVQAYLKDVADFFVSTGNIPVALPSYDAAVDATILKAASEL